MQNLTEEQKQQAYDIRVETTVFMIHNISKIIEKATKHGCFDANELSFVGSIYDNLQNGIKQAFDKVAADSSAAAAAAPSSVNNVAAK
jgi:capsid portal protein